MSKYLDYRWEKKGKNENLSIMFITKATYNVTQNTIFQQQFNS